MAALGWGGGGNPYERLGFGDIHGPKPYKFIGFGGIPGPEHSASSEVDGGQCPREAKMF